MHTALRAGVSRRKDSTGGAISGSSWGGRDQPNRNQVLQGAVYTGSFTHPEKRNLSQGWYGVCAPPALGEHHPQPLPHESEQVSMDFRGGGYRGDNSL